MADDSKDRGRYYEAARLLANVANPEARFLITSESLDDPGSLNFPQSLALVTWASEHESLFEGLTLYAMLAAFHVSIRHRNFHDFMEKQPKGEDVLKFLREMSSKREARRYNTRPGRIKIISEGDAAPEPTPALEDTRFLLVNLKGFVNHLRYVNRNGPAHGPLAEVSEKINRLLRDEDTIQSNGPTAPDIRIVMAADVFAALALYIRDLRESLPNTGYARIEIQAIDHYLDLVARRIAMSATPDEPEPPRDAPVNTPKRLALLSLRTYVASLETNAGAFAVRLIQEKISALMNETAVGYDDVTPVLTERESELRRRTSLLVVRKFVEQLSAAPVSADDGDRTRVLLRGIRDTINRVIGDSVWTPAKEKEARASDVRVALASVLDFIRNLRGDIPDRRYNRGELLAIDEFKDSIIKKIESVEDHGADLKADWKFRFEQLSAFVNNEAALARKASTLGPLHNIQEFARGLLVSGPEDWGVADAVREP